MKTVHIKYDPYEMKSVVKVEGKEIQKNKHCEPNLKRYLDPNVHMPIQAWIDPVPRDHWAGLLETICKMGDKDIVVDFSGRRVDYDSVKAALLAQNESRHCGANITFRDLEDEIIPDSEMQKRIARVVDLMLVDSFSEVVHNSGSAALIEKYEKLRETYEQIDAEQFRIVFTGTYSSGKSSAINAIIGKNLLPMAKGTCTAKVCKIVHKSKLNVFSAVEYEYKGNKKTFSCANEQEVQDHIRGAEDSVESLVVYTDLSDLYPAGMEGEINLAIIDTPGTDSATGNDTEKSEESRQRLSTKSHLEITKDVLKSKQKEMVVLVSDEKLEGENIVDLLDIIEEAAEDDEGSFNDRFLFAMNKCDDLSYSNEGESLDNSIRNFIDNIKKVPNSNRLRNIVNPRVFPITSGAALAVANGYTTKPDLGETMSIKSELYGYYSGFCTKLYYYSPEQLEDGFASKIGQIKEKHRDYPNFCLEQQSSAPETEKYAYIKALEGEMALPQRVLIHSGIPALKSAIQDYIKYYAYPIKVRQLRNTFTDILDELDMLNNAKYEALESAKKAYGDAIREKEQTEERKQREEENERTLVSVKAKMDAIKEKVDKIGETIPEIEEIRSSFIMIKNSIAGKVNGRREVQKNEGDAIVADISAKIDELTAQIHDTVKKVKDQKRTATDGLYSEFIAYLSQLEHDGLMSNGKFSLQSTVEYQRLVDKSAFKKLDERITWVDNPNKEHIEFGYGIGNFFNSIGRAWRTRKEPETIQRTYVNIEKYVSDNIDPIQASVDQYVEKLKSDYRSDIQMLKQDTKDRIDRVLELIRVKDQRIEEMRANAIKLAKDESAFKEETEKLKKVHDYIENLEESITYTQF